MPAITTDPDPVAETPTPYSWGCEQVAALLDISPRSVLRLAENGALPAYTVPGMKRKTWRFRPHEVEAVMQQQRRTAA